MDIDDFLDRELFDLGIAGDKGESTEKGIGDLQLKIKDDSGPLFESIKKELSKGRLESAEKKYVELWRLLMDQKLKWDKPLYDQVFSLSRQFASAISQAHEDVRKKASMIHELITRARSFLRQGNNPMTFKTYAQIQEINNTIPNVFFEEKKIIQERIMGFYMEMSSTINNVLIKKILKRVVEMDALVNQTDAMMRMRNYAGASEGYTKCVEEYNKIPEGFLKYKSRYGPRLLEIYKSISIQQEISRLQKQLGQLQAKRQQPHTITNMPASQRHILRPIAGMQDHKPSSGSLNHPLEIKKQSQAPKKEDAMKSLSPQKPAQMQHVLAPTSDILHRTKSPVNHTSGKMQTQAYSAFKLPDAKLNLPGGAVAAKQPASRPNSHAAAPKQIRDAAKIHQIREKKAVVKKAIADNFGK